MNIPKLHFFLKHQPPSQLKSFTTNYNLHYIFYLPISVYRSGQSARSGKVRYIQHFSFLPHSYFQFFLFPLLVNTLKQS